MKTGISLNIFYVAAALAFLLNGCTQYPKDEISDVFFLNRTALDMYLGDTARVVASPKKASYAWSSEDDSVAIVDQTGLVKAMNYGFTSIVVKSGNYEDRIDIHVKEYIPLVGITTSVDSVRISPGNTFKLWAYPDPVDASEYSFTLVSENPEIATIDRSGTITGISGGYTNIVVSDGEYVIKVHVTVVNADVVLFDAAGLWLFDDPDNLLKATIGTDLAVYAYDFDEGKLIEPVYYPVSDPSLKAITVARFTYFNATHGLPTETNGNYQYVNEYTLMFDFKIPETGLWYSFFKTNNSVHGSNAECMINPQNNTIGIGIPGYSSQSVVEDVWYRLIVAAKLPSSYDIFLDGTRIFTTTGNFPSIAKFSRFALSYPGVLLFADNNGEDNDIDVSAVALWGKRLTDEEISILGKANKYERE